MIMDNQSKIASKWMGTAYGDTSPSIKYIFPDHLGSSNTMCDDTGAFFNREEYYPFGETSFGSYGKKRYRFCGKERDEESGMYYYGARYYLSWTCRFVSVDPLAHEYPYLTPYNYAGNKPISHKDIDGMQSTGDKKNNNTGGGDTPLMLRGIDFATLREPAVTNVKKREIPKPSLKSSTYVKPIKIKTLPKKNVLPINTPSSASSTPVNPQNEQLSQSKPDAFKNYHYESDPTIPTTGKIKHIMNESLPTFKDASIYVDVSLRNSAKILSKTTTPIIGYQASYSIQKGKDFTPITPLNWYHSMDIGIAEFRLSPLNSNITKPLIDYPYARLLIPIATFDAAKIQLDIVKSKSSDFGIGLRGTTIAPKIKLIGYDIEPVISAGFRFDFSLPTFKY